MKQNILPLIQEHTRAIYDLENKSFNVKKINARHLLTITRFDLFAKLYYIKYRQSKPEQAKKVYCEHIKVFNPDLREPGRNDKFGLDKFITTFDTLIQTFKVSSFDDSVSVIPVDKNGVILDGAHRVAALAYFDKEVTIAQFDDVESKGLFNYSYFINRGLSIETADIIALEATNWCRNLYAACLWPKVSNHNDREQVKNFLKRYTNLLYEKNTLVSLGHLTQFVAKIYAEQDWVGTPQDHFKGAKDKALHCYSLSRHFEVLFFQSSLSLNDIVGMKEEIRSHFNYGKHVIHITDNDSETRYISELMLDKKARALWLNDDSIVSLNFIYEKLNELVVLFKYNCLLPFKTFVYKVLKS